MPRCFITTPEQVRFHYEAAGLVTRGMAWVVDQLILWAVRIALAVALGSGGTQVGFALVMLGIFAVDFGYYVYFEMFHAGRSPGKRLMGIRVVSSRGNRLGFADVLIRNVVRPLDTLPYGMTLGAVVAFVDPLRRRLGDLAADTLVVRASRAEPPEHLFVQRGRVNTFQADPALRRRILSRVTREERDLIYDLAMRRNRLEPDVRERLFAEAAKYFRHRYALPDDMEHLSDEQAVLNLALVLRQDRVSV